MNELALNAQPAAKDLLVHLAERKAFIDEPDRADLLLEASGSVRPPAIGSRRLLGRSLPAQ